MLLAVDIGNTNVTLGVFDGEKLRATWRMATDVHRMADEYASILLNLLPHENIVPLDVKEVSMCNVVPPLTTTFIDLSQRYFKTVPLVVGAGVKTGVRIRMDNPKEVGADRIADAVAAHHLYGGPVITIDLGTTTVFGIISKEGDYLGGVIATGIGTAAEALYSRTAQLPRVDLVRPKTVIGTNTITAMQSGIINGYASLVEGMLARIKKEWGEKAKVVATGGYSALIAKETKAIDEVNPDLTLIGLRLIYEMNRT
ncbi:MAG: pantothenate kinase [Chloroflexi bacterium RBG_16_51_9]|nr:MAG: pantothenate kinase [Chloroflexi bacterium RBG_16_51_9]